MADGNTTPRKGERSLDPVREAKAVQALRESLRQMGADDDEALLMDTIEGETSLFEMLDKLLSQIAADRVMIEGTRAVASDLETRADRFARRIEANRTLIEQAMMIAELDKVERPAATLSLSHRAPKVEIAEESDIPARFWKQGAPTLDKKALGEALKAGEAVPGACLSNAAPSLSLRPK